jgi:hypothetical protein
MVLTEPKGQLTTVHSSSVLSLSVHYALIAVLVAFHPVKTSQHSGLKSVNFYFTDSFFVIHNARLN